MRGIRVCATLSKSCAPTNWPSTVFLSFSLIRFAMSPGCIVPTKPPALTKPWIYSYVSASQPLSQEPLISPAYPPAEPFVDCTLKPPGIPFTSHWSSRDSTTFSTFSKSPIFAIPEICTPSPAAVTDPTSICPA